MNRRKKAGAAAKPPALTKPVAATPTAPVATNAMPARVSPTPKPAPAPASQPIPPTSKPAPMPTRMPAQAPKPAAAPHNPPLPSVPVAKSAAPVAKPGPPQHRRVLTRSDRVRAEWMEFDESWVKLRQAEVGARLEELLQSAEKTRQRGKALEQTRDRMIKAAQRDFAMAARAEWESRLEKAGLQAEDWSDITVEEMSAVEQVLACDEVEEEQGVYAQRQASPPNMSSKMHAESSQSVSSQPVGRPSQPPPFTTAPKPAAPAPPSAPPPKQQSSWFGWAAGLRNVAVTEEPEESSRTTTTPSFAAKKNASIIEDVHPFKSVPEPQPPPQVIQRAIPKPQSAASPEPSGFLTYAVPVSLDMGPLSAEAVADSDFCKKLDNVFVNSIKMFHDKAAEADANLACALTKMPTSDRGFTIRAHMVLMEQTAREIVQKRDDIIKRELLRRGYAQTGGDAAAVPTQVAPVLQPPGAFPQEQAPILERLSEPKEVNPEPEPDVDEVIEIPLKGKGKKKGKKVPEVKAAPTGRATPTPIVAATAAKSTTPAVKATPAPAPEKKNVPAASMWGHGPAKGVHPARPASPAPINTKVASIPAANGKPVPTPPALSPWEAMQAARAVGKAPEPKPPSPPAEGMWAPAMARTTSNKNAYAPSRPSRLAHVAEPESPEPPSPPPTREPTGSDYVTWFAGSSSEDEGGADDDGLSEDEDVEADDDDDEQGGHGYGRESGPGAFGGVLATLAGASPWALFGESTQPPPQKERARAASPPRGRTATATPTPARAPTTAAAAAAARYAPDAAMHGNGGGGGSEWMRWGAPGHAPAFNTGPSGFGAVAAGFGAGPSGARPMKAPWEKEDDQLDGMMEYASKALDSAAMSGRVEEAMAMFVTAQRARETLATPVGGRNATAWRR